MRLAIFIFVPAVFGVTASLSRAQTKSNMFDVVPTADGESLRDAVSKNVSYQLNRQWSEMHKIYDNRRNISLGQFVRDMNTRIKLVEFTPSSITYTPPSDYRRIDGCAVFAADVGDRGTIDAVIIARHFPDRWRLSEVAISPRKDPPKCIPKEK